MRYLNVVTSAFCITGVQTSLTSHASLLATWLRILRNARVLEFLLLVTAYPDLCITFGIGKTMSTPKDSTMFVLLGASGDLAKKKIVHFSTETF